MADKPSIPNGLSDLWWFIGIMVVLGAMWIAGGGPERYGDNPPPQAVLSPISSQSRTLYGSTYYSNSSVYSGGSQSSVADFRKVKISKGSAANEYQPGKEYIVLTASYSNNAPVAITGWTLTNGRGQKLVIQNSRFAEQTSTQATIPTGALIFDPAGKHVQGPIILNPGDKAYVITGSGQSFGKYPIKTSFKVNKCLGYVEEANGNKLNPPLSGGKCPDPKKEVVFTNLPDQCYDFVRSLARCHIPKIGENKDGERTVDGKTGIPKTCTNFILPILNYESCVKNHITDEDFLSNEWRVYLKQRWELWDDKRETITLYDASGQIIDQLTY